MRLTVQKGHVHVEGLSDLPPELHKQLAEVLAGFTLDLNALRVGHDALLIPQFVADGSSRTNLAPILGRLLGEALGKQRAQQNRPAQFRRHYPVPIAFDEVHRRACAFADVIEAQQEALASVMLLYESHEVVLDETARTLDLLRSLPENAAYFQRQIGPVAVFLPRNQPLYALASFALVLSLMAQEVHVKPPTSMYELFPAMAEHLALRDHFPNVHFSHQERSAFVQTRAACHADSGGPVTDAVIFTGTMANADQLRRQFDPRTLFIANGAGHNPVVVAADADISQAVASVLRLQLYNSGQDCANPNAVLVHRQCFCAFMDALREGVQRVRVGPYWDIENRVGPLGDPGGLLNILKVFIDNADFLDPLTQGVIHGGTGILEPTIIAKPLAAGGNYTEYFAPVFFVQCYERDDDLSLYFDDPRYEPNAMYISVYGHSPFVDGLLQRSLSDGRPLHDHTTILRNTDLHAPGVERGTQPYGGYGRGASCVSINGTVTAKPTLPQRDIFELLVRPALEAE